MLISNHKYESCKVCGLDKPDPSHFWNQHRMSESSYCLTYYPRTSKLTNNPIVFKNRDQYFGSDFNGKNELKKWVGDNAVEALGYCLNIIQQRKDSGKIKYTPCQVETRATQMPSIIWYQGACDYNKECKLMGLKEKFDYDVDSNYLESDIKNLEIVVDTREQRALSFHDNTKLVHKLDYGDYWSPNSKNKNIAIERKSLSDFVSTISGGHDRFIREIERAAEQEDFLYIVVEENINKAMAFNKLPQISRKIKASPDFVFHRVKSLIQQFPNIQFIFVDGRDMAQKLILQIYGMKEDPTICDWQYLIDKKIWK